MTVRLIKSGEVILVDLSSSHNAPNTAVSVLLQEQSLDKDNKQNKKAPASIDYVHLMRHGINALYAPERLIKTDEQISRTPMYANKSEAFYWDAKALAMPLASWSGGNYYLTALLIKNTKQSEVKLDLKNIRGQWLAGSFYPTDVIAPRDQVNDRTTLFLISEKPFYQAINSKKRVAL